ncbi:MAG: L-aspartate oxidase [Planctomycetaceae bacterium]|nr:L-aspartate oxidase [Planctomycetaceae bacterium]
MPTVIYGICRLVLSTVTWEVQLNNKQYNRIVTIHLPVIEDKVSSTNLNLRSSQMRYLVPFHPNRHSHFFTDILVIGGGAAGLRAALAASETCDVLLLCKAGGLNSNSNQAQGGIATVWDSTDTFERHVEDTLTAGGELCERSIVEEVVHNGPEQIREIINYGANFDKSGDCYALSREGGHRNDRILHAQGDATGKEIVRALMDEVLRRPNIRIWENTFSLDLLTDESGCRGAIVYWKKRDEKELIWAKQTILACGGFGQIYRETTNPEIATGDGVAMAYRAGAAVRDLEFVQFHPTVLYIAGSSRHLITEAMRGEGAYLIDRKGYRFMNDYDARGELAPRDIVSKAIVAQMAKTNHPNVYLDLTHKPADWIYKRFPGIAETCRLFGIDIAKDRIPVRPGAHYAMGGVYADKNGRTSLPGLWAAGEVASTGLHGANRLASNSLLEALVFGAATGSLASQFAMLRKNQFDVSPISNPPITSDRPIEQLDLNDMRNALKSLMWRQVGVVRNGEQLADAAWNVEKWAKTVENCQFLSAEGWELQNMLTVAALIIKGAINREESRGAHEREDFPNAKEVAEHTVLVNEQVLL